MHLSPHLYHRFVRPRWFTKKYIHDPILSHGDLADKTILDFGCGTGANSAMCQRGYYHGIDPDEQRIRYAKSLYPAYKFMVFDGRRIPLHDQSVDLVLIVAVLHHITDDHIANYLGEFRRVLKPSGHILVIEPFLCPQNKLNNWFMTRYDNGDFIRTADDYLQLFHNQNYKCEVLNKFKKLFLYHELFFTASPHG